MVTEFEPRPGDLGLARIERRDRGVDGLEKRGGRVPLATLLHASDSRALSHAFSDPPASPQAPDSSPETALRIAPTFSAIVTAPVFDSRRLHFS